MRPRASHALRRRRGATCERPLNPGRKLSRVCVITPELHRRGGTERSVWEHLERWREGFDLRTYTTSRAADAPKWVEFRRMSAVPGPHLVHRVSWVATNHALRRWGDCAEGHLNTVDLSILASSEWP